MVWTSITNVSLPHKRFIYKNDCQLCFSFGFVPRRWVGGYTSVRNVNWHSAIFFELKIKAGTTTDGKLEEEPIIGPTQVTEEAYREAFEALVVLADWNSMDTGEKCKFLQETAKILLEQQKLHATKNHRIGPLWWCVSQCTDFEISSWLQSGWLNKLNIRKPS